MLRGDTDFSQSAHLDRWDKSGVGFVFGFDSNKAFERQTNALSHEQYRELERKSTQAFAEREERQKQPRVRETIVREKEYKNIRLLSEDVASFRHRPTACKRDYRVV